MLQNTKLTNDCCGLDSTTRHSIPLFCGNTSCTIMKKVGFDQKEDETDEYEM